MSMIVLAGMLSASISAADGEGTVWDGTVADGYAGGTGSPNDPFIIENAAQLAFLAAKVNSGESYYGVYFRLANDIVMNDTSDWKRWKNTAPANAWTPIGGDNENICAFAGIFDGDGHIVIGLYIKSDLDFLGLFGRNEGTVKNLGVEKSYLIGGTRVGSIAGGNYGTISNCYNAGIVSGEDMVGGISGFSYYGVSFFNGCYNVGGISGTREVGGIIGYSASVITNCYNIGNISGNENVGGIAGSSDGDLIENSYNAGKISKGDTAALLAGNAYKTSGCYFLDAADGKTDEKGTALTDEQMKDKASYEGWDFDSVWEIAADKNGGYPTLRGMAVAEYENDANPGDANGDGTVNGKDASALAKYLAGWQSDADLCAADTNGDGTVNGKDLALLMKHLAGWEVDFAG